MVSSQRILLVAAEPREFDGVLRHCSSVKRVRWPIDWAAYGECAGRRFWMAANGAGPLHAGMALDTGVPECRPDAVVSLGFCGALDQAMEIGDVFVATTVVGAGQQWAMCVPGSDGAYRTGTLVSIPRVAQTAAEKAQLRATGGLVVEMEAAGVAQRAATNRVPAFCVRAVSDLAGQSFVTDFNGALRPDGHFATIRILSSVIRNPAKALPELIRLRRNCQIATRKLGDFIAGCRF
ncbi:MAG: hypothetical protein U0Q18_08415 [Bryobacteraceae bacterium]